MSWLWCWPEPWAGCRWSWLWSWQRWEQPCITEIRCTPSSRPGYPVIYRMRSWSFQSNVRYPMLRIRIRRIRTYVFGPPGSGSVSQRCGSGSGSFNHQAKIVSKTLTSTVLWLLFDFLSLKNDVNVTSKRNKQKNLGISFLSASWRSMTKIAGSGFRIRNTA